MAAKKNARRPARKAPSHIAVATAYTRGFSRSVVKQHPKKVGFAAGVAAALAALEVLA